MGIIQKLIAALLAVALIGSLPITASAGVSGAAGCDTMAGADSDDGCCGEAGSMNDGGCSLACAVLSAAAVGAGNEPLRLVPGDSPIAFPKRAIQRISGPPDTAPPKAQLR